MKTKYFLTLFCLSLLLFSSHVKADTYDCCLQNTCCDVDCGGCWYGTIGAGYAFSLKTGISNPDPSVWDAADQGYDADLKESPFFFIGFGRQFCGWMNLDVTYSYYETFHYQKYQTSQPLMTRGFTGTTRTRFFDLNHQNVLFTFSIDPTWSCLCYDFCGVRLHPLLGAGIGVGINQVDNFHTVGFREVDPTDTGIGSTSSIGDRVTNVSFAWQALAGLRFDFPCSPFNVDIGYRYYDGGRFKGPSKVVSNTDNGAGGFIRATPWKGKLKANEIFMNLGFCF